MTRLPRPTGAELVRTLGKAGCAVVPVHAGESFGPGLVSKVLRDTELTRDELIALMWPRRS